MQDRRGGRSRVTEKSLETAPLPGGSPSGTDVDDQFEEDSRQDSQERTTEPIRRAGVREEDAGPEEHPDDELDDDSSSESPTHTDRTPEEQQRFDELLGKTTTLEKGKAHADRKITEQGQELATARQENTELKERLGRFESQMAKIVSGRRAPDGGRQESGQETDFDSFSQDDGQQEERADNGFDVETETNNIKRVVASIFQDVSESKQERAQEREVNSVSQDLGVDAETAAGLINLKKEGSLTDLAEALDLATYPAEARQVKKQARQRQREAVLHPTGSGFSSNEESADEDALRKKAENLAKLPDSTRTRRQIESFITSHPDAPAFMAEAAGFNI